LEGEPLAVPEAVNVLGIEYRVIYCDNPADVDVYKRKSLWGQIDPWTRTIRIYRNGRPVHDLWYTLMHEIIHALAAELHIKILEDAEDETDLLAMGLTDLLVRNGWLRI
jgi:hypothetical protein